jgi:hypothetical protein
MRPEHLLNLFQCHHGVPASYTEQEAMAVAQEGFNATTAFLLHPLADCSRMEWARFNATTAFLLRCSSQHLPCLALVSMPPRRSCFGVEDAARHRLWPGFNATTAFLLGGGLFQINLNQKFQCHHGVPA